MTPTRVLLADDHTIVAQGLAALLRDEFDLVGTVTNGAELLVAARRLRPSVIVSDISMPGMRGKVGAESTPMAVIKKRVL